MMNKKRFKAIMLILIAIVIIGFAFLVWGNQTGRISIWANPIPVGFSVDTLCSKTDGSQIDKLSYTKGSVNYDLYSFKVYAGDSYKNDSRTDNGWVNISSSDTVCNEIYGGTCPNCYRQSSSFCSFGPHDPHGWNYRVIGHILSTSKNPLLGEKRATQCSGSTPTTSPTSTSTPTNTTTPTPSASTTSTPTITSLNTPTGLEASAIDQDTIELTWNADDNVGYYGIYNDGSDIALYELSGPFDGEEISYEVNGLNCNTEYTYYVKAYTGDIASDASEKVSATTSACSTGDSSISDKKPENLVAVGGDTYIGLSWDEVEGATGYDIYDCEGNLISSSEENAYIFTDMDCATGYCFYIVAHDATGNVSQKSDQAEFTTDACGSSSSSDVTSSDSSSSSTPSGSGIQSVTALVSTGASLWFNILIAILLIVGIGYFMFRNEIHNK